MRVSTGSVRSSDANVCRSSRATSAGASEVRTTAVVSRHPVGGSARRKLSSTTGLRSM